MPYRSIKEVVRSPEYHDRTGNRVQHAIGIATVLTGGPTKLKGGYVGFGDAYEIGFNDIVDAAMAYCIKNNLPLDGE